MFFIFGYQPSVKEVGPVEEISCPNCNNVRHWILTRVISSISFFFIPLIPVSFNYFQHCPICRHRQNLTKEEYQQKEPLAKLNKEAIESNMSEEEYQQRMNSL